jgi:transposase-like protein
MEGTLSELIEIAKHLPEKAIGDAIAKINEIKEEYEKAEKQTIPPCPRCKGEKAVRNGHARGKQAYLCRDCGKSFVETTQTALCKSHSGEAVWKEVIRDTVNGVSLDETAGKLSLHHETVFNMRHKILYCIEEEEKRNATRLTGVCEADETYLLENSKGQKLPPDYWRESRKHGAVAQKRGISDEYICVCAAAERNGNAVARAANRAAPGKSETARASGDRVSQDTLVLCDGAKGYGVLEETGKCSVLNIKTEGQDTGFNNINAVNNFHSYIKGRNRNARGFSTKYLNRYSALFSRIHNRSSFAVDEIYKLLCDKKDRYRTILVSQTVNLLSL